MKKDIAIVSGSPLPVAKLGAHTEARVALGRAGASLPTAAHLAFVGDHARARDAVWSEVDFDAVAAPLLGLGLQVLRLRSQAPDRATYLRRPDLGRRLDDASASLLVRAAASPQGRVALVIADGLSAEAIRCNAVAVASALLPRLEGAGLRVTTACLVEQGRVAIGDPIGEGLGAEVVAVLIGERPGLSAADSLGCYVTWAPKPGTPDSRRNCVSNVRDGGLSADDAAGKIAWIVSAAVERKVTGVALKEEAGAAILPPR